MYKPSIADCILACIKTKEQVIAENPRISRIMAAMKVKGALSITEIVKYSNIGSQSAYYAIDQMRECGMLKEVGQGGRIKYTLKDE